MNILVTGGTGVVGTAAIPALIRAGHKVRLLSRHAGRDVASFPEAVEPFEADIAHRAELERAVDGCDAVLHIAGIVEENPPETTFQRVNVEGTHNVVAAASAMGQPLVLFVSSLGAERGNSAYHRSKRSAEEVVRGYGGKWIILRPASVYGPGDETVSMLLKMQRTLPAVPVVSVGQQPFQPLWYADFGEVVARTVERPGLAGRTFDLAGPDVTTSDEILAKLTEITGRAVPRLSVPVWVTEVGVQALEAFGGLGRNWLRGLGLNPPLNSAKLEMLLEGNVITGDQTNALPEFVPSPTRLDDGLRMLVDLLPEQLPGDGFGAVVTTTYFADIQGSRYNAARLLDLVCARIQEVMPIEFAAEPGTRHAAEPGGTLTGAVTGRGNLQVRLEERTGLRATFVTIEGHPLAGVMQLHTENIPGGVRFNVHIAAQPANVLDWLAMRTIGGPMQRANWRTMVRRVIALSGGTSAAGVRSETHAMNDDETADLRTFAERTVGRQQRDLRMRMTVHAPTATPQR